jgi:hypothetical protein
MVAAATGLLGHTATGHGPHYTATPHHTTLPHHTGHTTLPRACWATGLLGHTAPHRTCRHSFCCSARSTAAWHVLSACAGPSCSIRRSGVCRGGGGRRTGHACEFYHHTHTPYRAGRVSILSHGDTSCARLLA